MPPPPPASARAVTHAQHLAASLLPARLVVVHDADAGGEHDVAELAGGQQVVDLLFDLAQGQVEAGGHHAALVDAALERHHDLAGAVVVNNVKVANVLCRAG